MGGGEGCFIYFADTRGDLDYVHTALVQVYFVVENACISYPNTREIHLHPTGGEIVAK